MITASLLLLFTPPPEPPPPAPQHEAAIALWAENVTEAQKDDAIRLAIYGAAWSALERSGLRVGSKRWTEKEAALRARMTERVPKDRSQIDREAFYCASDRVARDMSVEQIEKARRFFSTPEGKLFWVLTEPEEAKLKACYKAALNLEAQEADYQAVGITVPKQVRERARVTVVE